MVWSFLLGIYHGKFFVLVFLLAFSDSTFSISIGVGCVAASKHAKHVRSNKAQHNGVPHAILNGVDISLAVGNEYCPKTITSLLPVT
ncbi:hypothetical protein TNCT_374571 [Trichonephila clavata]|uniref:Uncharacterized protein n=1 Tax=Trichonephila clavata TaxID=2740835 RepID=A0A8X6HSA1_TRICU|nr:hypothetical protein TNCT_374571 [Trichonephila clavata]